MCADGQTIVNRLGFIIFYSRRISEVWIVTKTKREKKKMEKKTKKKGESSPRETRARETTCTLARSIRLEVLKRNVNRR